MKSVEELIDFLSGEDLLAREKVFIYGPSLVLGENSTFTLEDCLITFFRVDSQHFLQLEMTNTLAFFRTNRLVAKFNSPRIGIYVHLAKGPNCDCRGKSNPEYISPSVVYYALNNWPSLVRIIVGYATHQGPVNQYTKRDMSDLYNVIEALEKKLDTRFIIQVALIELIQWRDFVSPFSFFQFEAYFLAHKFNLIHNMVRVRNRRWLVVLYAPFMSYAVDVDYLREMVYFVGPKRVYLNVPEEMRSIFHLQLKDPQSVAVGARKLHSINYLIVLFGVAMRINMLEEYFYGFLQLLLQWREKLGP